MNNSPEFDFGKTHYCPLTSKDIDAIDCYEINLENGRVVIKDHTKLLRRQLKTTYKTIYDTCKSCSNNPLII